MGFYIFLFIRVIVLPFILFKIFHNKLDNPFWSINILFLPIMWAIFYWFYAYPVITWICAGVGFLAVIILLCLSRIPNKFILLKNAQEYIIFNFFEIFISYIPSALCSGFLFSNSGSIYLLWIELFRS